MRLLTSYKPCLLKNSLMIISVVFLALALGLLKFSGCAPSPETGKEGAAEKPPGLAFDYAVLDTIYGHREVGDIDLDGLNDIVVSVNGETLAGLYWYRAPGHTRHLIADIRAFEDFSAYRSCDLELADIDGDRDLDIVGRVGTPGSDTEGVMVWFENSLPSEGLSAAWKRHDIGANNYAKDIHAADFDRGCRPWRTRVKTTAGSSLRFTMSTIFLFARASILFQRSGRAWKLRSSRGRANMG